MCCRSARGGGGLYSIYIYSMGEPNQSEETKKAPNLAPFVPTVLGGLKSSPKNVPKPLPNPGQVRVFFFLNFFESTSTRLYKIFSLSLSLPFFFSNFKEMSYRMNENKQYQYLTRLSLSKRGFETI